MTSPYQANAISRDQEKTERLEDSMSLGSPEKLDALALHFFIAYYKSSMSDMVARLLTITVLLLVLFAAGVLAGPGAFITAGLTGVYFATEVWFAQSRNIRLRTLTDQMNVPTPGWLG